MLRQVFWLTRPLSAFPFRTSEKWLYDKGVIPALPESGFTAAGPLQYFTGFPFKPLRAPEQRR